MRVFISGYGRMGKMVESVLSEMNIECVGKTDDIKSVNQNFEEDVVCIDFSTPIAFKLNYKCYADKFKAVVVGTTGWLDIKDAVFDYFRLKKVTMIWASNFSIGVNVLMAATEKVASILHDFGNYNSYIIEKHHKYKIDSPSGTAKSLAEIVENGMVKPDIYSIRQGEIKGEHSVFFESDCDRITLEHEAFSRRGFALGAIKAAEMTSENNGIFEFKDIILRHHV